MSHTSRFIKKKPNAFQWDFSWPLKWDIFTFICRAKLHLKITGFVNNQSSATVQLLRSAQLIEFNLVSSSQDYGDLLLFYLNLDVIMMRATADLRCCAYKLVFAHQCRDILTVLSASFTRSSSRLAWMWTAETNSIYNKLNILQMVFTRLQQWKDKLLWLLTCSFL